MEGDLIEPNQVVANYRDPAQQADAVLSLLASSIERGLAPEALEKLVALQERVMASASKQAYYNAMKAFQAKCPVVGKNRTAKIRSRKGEESSYEYGFADLACVADTIRALCKEFGFSYRWDQKWDGKVIEVTCTVNHVAGHSEVTTFAVPIDSGAVMSDMQKFAAATTFARRHSLVLAFGLSIGDDQDGREAYPAPPRDQSAPKTPPRGQRETPITGAEIKDIVTFFKGEFPNATVAEWAGFVADKVGREFDVTKASQWTRGDLATCWKVLRGEA